MADDKGPIVTWLPIIFAALTLVVGGGWFQQCSKTKQAEKDANDRMQQAQKDASERLVNEYLIPVQTALKDNAIIYDELKKNYLVPNRDTLESYLFKIRQDGIRSHSLMRQRINTMVEHNNKILTLLGNYAPYIINDKFKTEADAFRNHALRYNDRWNAIPDLASVQKGKLPEAMAFPRDFPQAVSDEISARKQK